MAALGLPAALLFGILADVVAAVLRDRRGASIGAPVAEAWSDLRRVVARREAVGLWEVTGGLAALLGVGLVAAASLGAAPGSIALVYVSLAAAAAGAHLAAAVPATKVRAARAAAARRRAAAAEVAVAVAVGAAFLRWGADGLEAVRGAQEVLGAGLRVGPPRAAAGLLLAAAALLGAGALRLPPVEESRRGRGRPAASALVVRACRWGLAGATALLVSILVAAGGPGGGLAGASRAGWVLTAAVCAALLGAARVGIEAVDARWGPATVPAGLAAAAAGALALVVVA